MARFRTPYLILLEPMTQPTFYGIRTIAEQSVGAWFATNAASIPGVPVNLGQTAEIRSVPVIIVHAESASAAASLGAYWLGNFEITFKIYVYSSADDAVDGTAALELHRSRVEAVSAIMQDLDGLKASWTQGSLYGCWQVSDDEGVSDRRFGNVLSFTMVSVYPPA